MEHAVRMDVKDFQHTDVVPCQWGREDVHVAPARLRGSRDCPMLTGRKPSVVCQRCRVRNIERPCQSLHIAQEERPKGWQE